MLEVHEVQCIEILGDHVEKKIFVNKKFFFFIFLTTFDHALYQSKHDISAFDMKLLM